MTLDLRQLYSEVSNWGRWGEDDEAGTLNLIGPAQRFRAMATVTEGVTVSCSRELDTGPSDQTRHPALWSLIRGGDVAPQQGVGIAADRLVIAPHGGANTHVDALSHVFLDGRMYNDRPASLVTSQGVRVNDMSAMVEGIFSRAVLFDMPLLRGVDYIPYDEPITPEDLDAAERRFGVSVLPGDILAVSTGREARVAAEGRGCERVDGVSRLAGLAPECLRWLRARDIAVLMGDGGQDALGVTARHEPKDVHIPLHVGALVFMGLPLVDCASFVRLAPYCRELERWEFALTLAPTRCFGSTGDTVNPIALL